MKFVDPKNDLDFKKIFGNEQKKGIFIFFLKESKIKRLIPNGLDDDIIEFLQNSEKWIVWSRQTMKKGHSVLDTESIIRLLP